MKEQKRYSSGLSLASFYTWSRSIVGTRDGVASGITYYTGASKKDVGLTCRRVVLPRL